MTVLIELREAIQLALYTNLKLVQFFARSGCQVTQGEMLNFEIREAGWPKSVATMHDYDGTTSGPVRAIIIEDGVVDHERVTLYRNGLLAALLLPTEVTRELSNETVLVWSGGLLFKLGYFLNRFGSVSHGFEVLDRKGKGVGMMLISNDVVVFRGYNNKGGRRLIKDIDAVAWTSHTI